jgi:hypothetical protein
MNEKIVMDTMYVLLSGMYPTVSGGIGNMVGCVIFAILATLALYGVYWIATDTVRRYYTENKCDYFARCLGVAICSAFCLAFCICGWSCRIDYKKEKMNLIMERMKHDRETMERVEKIKSVLVEIGEDVERFR